MNPWRKNLLDFSRDMLRFSLWLCVILDGLLVALFGIAFVACFLWNAWGWCWRTWFREPW